MGKLLCEKNVRDVWCRNESVRAEIGPILQTHTHTRTHARARTRARVSYSSIDYYYYVHHRSESIHTVKYDGSDLRQILKSHEFLPHPFAISLFGNYLYWTEWRTNSLVRVSYIHATFSETSHAFRHKISVNNVVRNLVHVC